MEREEEAAAAAAEAIDEKQQKTKIETEINGMRCAREKETAPALICYVVCHCTFALRVSTEC